MQVIEVSNFGGPEVLTPRAADDLKPGPGEVVVATAFADVLFIDAMVRSGTALDYFPIRPPYVPGNGVSGEVIAIGSGVGGVSIGDRVIGHTGGDGGRGGYAEQAIVVAADAVPVPDGVDLAAAAGLLHDGTTALGLMEGTGAAEGETVLVLGAAGGLGILLVQYALAAGARVIGAVRGPLKRDLVLRSGATAAVDYADPDWTEQVLAVCGTAGPDVVFDGVGGTLGASAFALVAAGGRFSAHGAPGGGFAVTDRAEATARGIAVRGIEQVQFGREERLRLTARALADAAAERIRPVIGQVFALAAAADAHRAIEGRKVVAKTLLQPQR
jgi:NADPH2:quinone reductase